VEAALAQQKGVQPPGLDPAAHRVRSASFVSSAARFAEAAQAAALAAEAGTAHVSI
jgi:hypothetical protein